MRQIYTQTIQTKETELQQYRRIKQPKINLKYLSEIQNNMINIFTGNAELAS